MRTRHASPRRARRAMLDSAGALVLVSVLVWMAWVVVAHVAQA